MTLAWPYPGDTPLQRARRIANSLLAMLPTPDREAMTARAHAFGETWLGATLMTYTPDQAITADLAAELLVVSERQIRGWATMPHPEHPDRPLLPRAGRQRNGRGRRQTYLVRDLLDASAVLDRVRRREPT